MATDKKVITFYPDGYAYSGYPWQSVLGTYEPKLSTYNECIEMLDLPELESFSTVQMCLLMEPRVKEYDMIRIFNDEDDVIDIINRHDGTYACDRTDRELRYGHNLYKLWEAGEFDA